MTRLEHLRSLYVRGRIDVETLEDYAALMIERGVADEPYTPGPPPRRPAEPSYVER